jgi:ribosomal protein S18 acetylase RimI-like enzyme
VQADRPVELSRIYVAANWIGRGVGAAIMQRCIDEARASDSDVLWLGVWERNERAIKFYEKWGFTKVGEHVFVLGSDPQTDWLMARAI